MNRAIRMGIGAQARRMGGGLIGLSRQTNGAPARSIIVAAASVIMLEQRPGSGEQKAHTRVWIGPAAGQWVDVDDSIADVSAALELQGHGLESAAGAFERVEKMRAAAEEEAAEVEREHEAMVKAMREEGDRQRGLPDPVFLSCQCGTQVIASRELAGDLGDVAAWGARASCPSCGGKLARSLPFVHTLSAPIGQPSAVVPVVPAKRQRKPRRPFGAPVEGVSEMGAAIEKARAQQDAASSKSEPEGNT